MTVSKWRVITKTDYLLELESDLVNALSLYKSGFCALASRYDVMGIEDITEFIAMMQEAHELARQHFGEQRGEQE